MKPIIVLAILALPTLAIAQTSTTDPQGRPTTPAPVPSQPPPPVPSIPPSSAQNRGLAAPAEKTAPAGRPTLRGGAGPADSTPYSGAPSRTSDPQALPK